MIGYKGAVIVGNKLNGQPDRRWVSGKTEAEVREKAEALKTARNTGMLADTPALTFADYLGTWLEHVAANVKPKTLLDYKRVVDRRLVPLLGKLKLEKLRPLDIERAVQRARVEVSPQDAARTLTIARMARKQAVRWQMIPRNYAESVTAPG